MIGIDKNSKIGFGGGCHWCTEAVFQNLKGVIHVDQGWIASDENNTAFSEAVIVKFDPSKIDLKTLLEIHLYTHKSTANHSMRQKYRSAVYSFSEEQKKQAKIGLDALQPNFYGKIITQVLPFKTFKPTEENFQNYYAKNPEKPFCKSFIQPKLRLLLDNFSEHIAPFHLKNRI